MSEQAKEEEYIHLNRCESASALPPSQTPPPSSPELHFPESPRPGHAHRSARKLRRGVSLWLWLLLRVEPQPESFPGRAGAADQARQCPLPRLLENKSDGVQSPATAHGPNICAFIFTNCCFSIKNLIIFFLVGKGALEFVSLSQQAFQICLVFVVCVLYQDGNSNKSFLLRIWCLHQERTVCTSSPERKEIQGRCGTDRIRTIFQEAQSCTCLRGGPEGETSWESQWRENTYQDVLEALDNEPETAAQSGLKTRGKAQGVLGKMAMAPNPSLAQMYTSPVAVAVWEWQDELGTWHPYSATVCSYIEQQFVQQKGQRFGLGSLAHSIPLGQADPLLAPYIIDLPSWTQFRQDTGTMRAVRRHLFPQHSAPGQGIVWEWLSDDGSWTAYEASVCDYLEQQVARGNQLVDLAPLGYNYTVNYATHMQTNKTSSFCRSVRRQAGPPYPVTTIIAPPGHTGIACSCHQCLSGGGTGPVSGRYRHSMTSLPAYPVPQPPHRTTIVFGAHQAFAPYNKPSLSGARSAPRLNTTNPWGGVPPSLGNQPLYCFSLSHLGPQHQPPGSSTASGASASLPSGPVSSPGSIPATVPVQMPKSSRVQQALAGMTSVLMSAIGLPVCLSRAPQPTSPPASCLASKSHSSVKRLRKMSMKGGTPKPEPEQVIRNYTEELKTAPDEDCIICMEKLSMVSGYSDVTDSKTIGPVAVGCLIKCSHSFHLLCLLAMYCNGNKDGSLQCPSCKTIYGEKTGTQPRGKMEVFKFQVSLPGHEDCGTILIVYNIPHGIQGPEHPNPGKPFTARGFPRQCYLPDNAQGRKVLELLKVAWKRRLIFTVGTSSTTGETDTVVWNEIHHKTEMDRNMTGHGYPDPNYLQNVLAELAAQGVTEDCLEQQ